MVTIQSEVVKESLKKDESFFSKLSKIDALFIPGGDPGATSPEVLFDYLEKQAKVLKKYHPEAEIWVSPQSFDKNEMGSFLELVKRKPEWLTGIVYGPQVRLYVDKLREVIPDKYPIRRYPDITHNYDAQYPVPNWDFAYAATENRESINPRPTQQKDIFNTINPDKFNGFITYSEGVNDDVNKMVWSRLGWNPEADVMEILQDYSRYFISPDFETTFAQGLLDLEQNWQGPLLGNTSVYSTHQKFQTMEEEASPRIRLNWRFQIAQFRSYYDAYTRSRLLYETQLEDKAISVLRRAHDLGSFTAMEKASHILEQAKLHYVSNDWRERLFQLAEALFQSIRMQKTVDEYFAVGIRRGANLDLVNHPLNDRIWLNKNFERIKGLDDEEARLAEIKKIVKWDDPGPGGFYDDLGSLGNQPHLVNGENYNEDPVFLKSPFVGFTIGDRVKDWKISWARHIQTLYGQPLKMKYTNLDPNAQYLVKITYTKDLYSGDKQIRLLTDNGNEVHAYMDKPEEMQPLTFDIPIEATSDGELILIWNSEEDMGGTGRGCQVAEVWLMKD